MSIEELKRPERIDEDRIEKLKELFPEAFGDGKLNLQVLKEEIEGMDDDLVEDSLEEFFGLQWVGKREARKLAYIPPQGTVRFIEGEGFNENKTKNTLISGDNLEVLRILQKSYMNKIKMIYIDPPYNTGNDFIYQDDYKEPTERYLQKTGQADDEGLLTTNPKADGRYHANWLNMMYPRLKLARNLLRDDGVMFVSIDDHELHNLRIILDEIFGEENFEGIITWRRRHNQPNDKTKMIGNVREYILAYAKNSTKYKESGIGKIDITAEFSNPDNDPKGDGASKPWKVGSGQSGSRYKITSPTGVIFEEEWMGDKDTFQEFLKEGRIYFTRNGDGLPRKKYYRFEREDEGQCATNWWHHEYFGHNQGANQQLTRLFGRKNVFSNPKPTKLIKNLLKIANVKDEDLVLDFFAGSGTTGHAVMELNKEDLQKRNFILIQIPEKTQENSKAFELGYTDIISITKDRLKKSIDSLNENEKNNTDPYLGFKVLELRRTNINKWENAITDSITDIESKLDLFTTNPFTADSVDLDIVTELMLLKGFPLDSKIKNEEFGNNIIWFVQHEDVPFTLIVCLDEKLYDKSANFLVSNFEDSMLICPDASLTNKQKIVLSEVMNVKTI